MGSLGRVLNMQGTQIVVKTVLVLTWKLSGNDVNVNGSLSAIVV